MKHNFKFSKEKDGEVVVTLEVIARTRGADPYSYIYRSDVLNVALEKGLKVTGMTGNNVSNDVDENFTATWTLKVEPRRTAPTPRRRRKTNVIKEE